MGEGVSKQTCACYRGRRAIKGRLMQYKTNVLCVEASRGSGGERELVSRLFVLIIPRLVHSFIVSPSSFSLFLLFLPLFFSS